MGSWLATHTDLLPNSQTGTPFYFMAILWPASLKFCRRDWQIALLTLLLISLGSSHGLITTRALLSRTSLDLETDWAPSRHQEWEFSTLLRITSWAENRPDGRWKAAGRILGRPPEAPRGPQVGQGVLLQGNGPAPRPGDLYQARVRFRVPRRGDLPGMFCERRFLAGRDLQWTGSSGDKGAIVTGKQLWVPLRDGLSRSRETLARKLKELLPGPEGELAGAILLGRRTASSRLAAQPFGQLGLAHLFAVSGLHVGVLLGMVLLPTHWLGLCPGKRWLLMFFLLPPYTLLTGLPGSVVRAAGLALLATLGPVIGRKVDSLQALGLLFWGNLVWQPGQVMDTGVLLSYGAVGSILLWSRIRSPGLILAGRLRKATSELLQMGLAAQWGTLPAVAASFGQISLFSPLANLVAIPLFSLAVWASVLGLILPSSLGAGLAFWAWAIWRGLGAGVALVGNLLGTGGLGLPVPGPGILLSWLGVSILTAALLPTHRALRSLWSAHLWALLSLVLGVVCFALGPRLGDRPDGPRLWQFDVGQGDAALVQFPDGWSAWIDTGGCWQDRRGQRRSPMERDLLPWLGRWGAPSWEAILLSHGHRDHTGGALALQEQHPAGTLYGAGRARPDSAQAGVWPRPVHRWGDWTLEILYPPPDLPDHYHENDHSMVVALRRGSSLKFLWTGDLEARGEALLMESWQEEGAQVWKAGHHGSHTSGTAPFMERVRPRLVVLSCGAANRYGHPSHGAYVVGQDTLAVARTDRDGSLEFRWNGAGQGRWRARGGPWQRLP